MLTDEEWRSAYAYLLQRMVELRNASSVVVELQQVTRMRFEDDLRPEKPERRARRRRRSDGEVGTDLFAVRVPDAPMVRGEFPKNERQDLDVVRNRAPTPREVFHASIDVAVARLREFPAIATRLSQLFERPPTNLQWRPDASEGEFSGTQETFNAAEFSLDEGTMSEIERVLHRIETMLKEKS